ncbi:FtsX-like permease family protein [bacterium]|nr:FtsX-like permease family protein [bacterium]
MTLLHGFMLRDLRGASKVRSLWVFGACLLLGIALIAACGSLLQLVRDGFEQQERNLFGGDLQISQRQAISEEQEQWLTQNATLSRLVELRTMMGTESGSFTVVELQSVDNAYPLYGDVTLEPAISMQEAVQQADDGLWGAAFDPALVEQLGLAVGQRVSIGELEVELRAMIVEQPDRSLRADLRGPPVIVDAGALQASGLLLPTSLVDYDYRVRIDGDLDEWREQLIERFPNASWEVRTVEERGEIIGERLDQVASVLLLIGFSTLLIGGLGVANSVSAYLQTKLRTIATLQSLGSRAKQVATVYIGQIALLAALASTLGAFLGSFVAWSSAQALSERLPIEPSVQALIPPTVLAILLGIFTALAFTLPTLGRTLDMPTASLIKGVINQSTRTPKVYRWGTLALAGAGLVLLLMFVPEPLIAIGFVICIAVLLLLLDGIVWLIRKAAEYLMHVRVLDGHFALRLAVAGLYRPGASLRPMLLSLGTALTLLVASALVIASTYNTLNSSVPERSPALVLYDLQAPQVADFNDSIAQMDGYLSHAVAPLVLGRLTKVNDELLSDSDVAERALEANDEQKLSYRLENIDNTTIDRGEIWPANYEGPPLVAMEDREADQLGLEVGDTLEFTILGETVIAELSAIYTQARFATSFWLEAVFTDNVLDPFITRYIGSVMLEPEADIAVQSELGVLFPNVVTIRTAKILEASRSILSSAGLAMMLIAAVSLSASVLVMASVVAVNRQRQVYEASIMHAIGTRMNVVMRSVVIEYALLAVVLSAFAMIVGGVIAQLILSLWLKLPSDGVAWAGALVASSASVLCLMAGAAWLVSTLKVSPAVLLKRGA